jgi:signal transduction histidine kinase
VSVLMMGYLSHELEQPMDNLKSLLQDIELRLRPYAFNTDSRTHLSAEILQSTIRSAFDLAERSQSTCELMNTVVGDIESLTHLGFGRMTLTIEFVDVTAIIRHV